MTETKSPSQDAPSTPWRDKDGIAAHFGVCVRTITNWMQDKTISCRKKGRIVIFHIHECEKELEAYKIKSVACMRGGHS